MRSFFHDLLTFFVEVYTEYSPIFLIIITVLSLLVALCFSALVFLIFQTFFSYGC